MFNVTVSVVQPKTCVETVALSEAYDVFGCYLELSSTDSSSRLSVLLHLRTPIGWWVLLRHTHALDGTEGCLVYEVSCLMWPENFFSRMSNSKRLATPSQTNNCTDCVLATHVEENLWFYLQPAAEGSKVSLNLFIDLDSPGFMNKIVHCVLPIFVQAADPHSGLKKLIVPCNVTIMALFLITSKCYCSPC